MKHVIAKIMYKSLGPNSKVGYLWPTHTISDDDTINFLDTEKRISQFPNKGSLFVPKNYLRIYKSFNFYELFKVEYENCKSYDNSDRSCKFQLKSYKKLPLIISGSIEDISTKISLPFKDLKYFFLEDSGKFFGPFCINMAPTSYTETSDFEYEDYNYDIESDYPDLDELNTEIQNETYEYDINYLNYDDLSVLELPNDYLNTLFEFDYIKANKYLIQNSYQYNIDNFTVTGYVTNIEKLVLESNFTNYILKETDNDIIEWSHEAFPEGYTTQQVEKWLTNVDANKEINKIRLDKLSEIKAKTTEWNIFIDSYLKNQYFNTEEGKQKVNSYIKTYREDLLKEYESEIRNEVREKSKDLNIIQDKIQQLYTEKRELEDEISKIKEEKELTKQKSRELSEIETKIENKLAEYSDLQKITDYNKEIEKLQVIIAYNSKEKEKIDEQLEIVKKEYFSKTKEGAYKRVTELMPIVKALNFEYQEEVEAKVELNVRNAVNKYRKDDIINIETYLEEFKKYLEENNRQFSNTDIVNLLVNSNQNFLTVLVGLPGVGKTSLANLLATFNSSSDFNIEIPVARGWNSRKNLLGFFNPLKGNYQNDEYGIVSMLHLLNSEDDLLKNIPVNIILDEANLSQIEHYWSDFINLSDKEFARQIKLSDKKIYTLPTGLKFIFTINNDHTTELLSPRLVDRASVIRVNYDQRAKISFKTKSNNATQYEHYYSQEVLNKYFLPLTYSLTQQEEKILNEICGTLYDGKAEFGKQIIVSPRKHKIITQYCSVSRNLFKLYLDNPLIALDYAVLQNILPLINGAGKQFEKRLNKLKEICGERSLNKSTEEIDSILIKGSEYNNYNFF